MKYYLKNDKNQTILSFTMKMDVFDFIIKDTEVINKDLLPEIFKGTELINEKLDTFFHYVTDCYVKYNNLYELDDIIVDRLRLSEKMKVQGRLTGAQYLICYLEKHFKSEEYNVYVTPEREQTISFLRCFGWNRMFLDVPKTWEEL